MEEHNHVVPLVGGPLCGESMSIRGCRLPDRIPMHHDGRFYTYNLIVEQQDGWWKICYEFDGEVEKPNGFLKNQP